MEKTFSLNIKYWDKKTFKKVLGKNDKITKQPTYVDAPDYINVDNVIVKANNDIEVYIKDKPMFCLNKDNGGLFLSIREINPLKSAMCNEWNVMLPLVTYVDDIM